MKDDNTMKYRKVIKRIEENSLTRSELTTLQLNAEKRFADGDKDAHLVLAAIKQGKPLDKYMLFMGFCPKASIDNRLDVMWKESGICRFDFVESKRQVKGFNEIWSGDLVVLKKVKKIGETMTLHGYGRVNGIEYDSENRRFLSMNWSNQEQIIEVPIMGCNSTVSIKTIETVKAEMPNKFWEWLDVHDTET